MIWQQIYQSPTLQKRQNLNMTEDFEIPICFTNLVQTHTHTHTHLSGAHLHGLQSRLLQKCSNLRMTVPSNISPPFDCSETQRCCHFLPSCFRWFIHGLSYRKANVCHLIISQMIKLKNLRIRLC